MKLKHGTVRLDAAAEWLSKTTGRTFTADDLIDAHNKLPIYALIPKSLARPEYSAVVCHAVQKKAVEVAEAADRMAKKAPLKQVDVVELATETLPEDAALRYKWEKTAHEEGVYLLSARDLELLDIHGVQQLHRGVSIFNRWIGRPIQFGNPVDITPDMLAVRRSQLVKFAEIVALEQPEARPAAQEQAAPAKPKRETQADRIALYVSECERRAAELGETFDRARMPGTKADFLDLLHALDAGLRTIKSVGSLDRYLNGYQWEGGRQPSAAPLYARLFPEARIRVPGAVSQQRGKS